MVDNPQRDILEQRGIPADTPAKRELSISAAMLGIFGGMLANRHRNKTSRAAFLAGKRLKSLVRSPSCLNPG
jgi:hypothetical protein